MFWHEAGFNIIGIMRCRPNMKPDGRHREAKVRVSSADWFKAWVVRRLHSPGVLTAEDEEEEEAEFT